MYWDLFQSSSACFKALAPATRNNFITFHPTFFFSLRHWVFVSSTVRYCWANTLVYFYHTQNPAKHSITKTRTQQEFKYLGGNPTRFSQGTERTAFQGQQPGTAQVSTQEGFPPTMAKGRISGLCSTCKSTCPCSELPSEVPAAYSTHSNCCASSALQGWWKEAETGKGEVECRMKVGSFPSDKITYVLLCSTPHHMSYLRGSLPKTQLHFPAIPFLGSLAEIDNCSSVGCLQKPGAAPWKSLCGPKENTAIEREAQEGTKLI